jgi:membrane protein DedA with SNARE-associated domain
MVERFVDWLGPALHPWGYILLAVATMLEASAFVGLFVPGEAALLLAGFLCHEGKLSLVLVILLAFAGAVVGDSIGYEIGRHGGDRLRDTRVGRWIGHQRWDKARHMLQHHGGRAVFLGRFVGMVRALVPAVAGDAHLEYRRFLLWNVLGAAAGSAATVLAGFAAGSAYTVVARWLGWGSVVIVAAVVAGAITVHLVHKRHSAA